MSDAVRDNMRGRMCPYCYGTIFPGDFHYCPAETSDFTLLRKERDALKAKLDVAVEALKRYAEMEQYTYYTVAREALKKLELEA
jgi:hypothetical protein